MRPIRTYLLIHTELGWVTSVHRDFESLSDTWQPYLGNRDVTGIIHIGLDRPDNEVFNEYVFKYQGYMILTASARWALLAVCKCATPVVGVAESIPLYIALNGWGYETTSEDIGLASDEEQKQDNQELAINPTMQLSVEVLNLPVRASNCLRENGIFLISDLVKCAEEDLQSFPRFGKKSLQDINSALAQLSLEPIGFSYPQSQIHKYSENLSSKSEPHINLKSGEILAQSAGALYFVPEWLLPVNLADIGLKVRTLNALDSIGFHTIGDIVNLTRDFYLKIPRFGSNSLVDLINRVRLVVDLYRPTEEVGENDAFPNSDYKASQLQSQFRNLDKLSLIILQACSSIGPLKGDIVRARMGVNSEQKTLQEIAIDVGVTRERIRQLESKGMEQIGRDSIWRQLLKPKLDQMLFERESPLPFSGLSILDSWFDGIEKMRTSFEYILDNKYILNKEFAIIEANGILFISRISQLEWNSKVKQAIELLEKGAENRWLLSEAKRYIDELLIDRGRELRSELWASSKSFVNFSIADANQEPVLLSYGKSSEALIAAVLNDSDRPVHYSELPILVKERYGKDIDVRRANNAASEIALNYGKGSYGLLKHCPLNSQERDGVLNEVLSIMSNGSIDRQWSCDELVDELNVRDIDFDGRLNKYSLNIALMDSAEIKSVGRLVWTQSKVPLGESLKRIDISQAVRALLEKTGRPMSTSEIKTELKRDRGVSHNFQVFPNEYIIAISTGVWGLIDRDLSLNREEQDQLRVAVAEVLRNRNFGIHVSEIAAALEPYFELASRIKDPVGIFAIAQRSELISKSPGDYLYLTEWGGPRRKKRSQVILELLTEAGRWGIEADELVRKASQVLGREIPKNSIYADINVAGGIFNQEAKRWILHSEDFDTEVH